MDYFWTESDENLLNSEAMPVSLDMKYDKKADENRFNEKSSSEDASFVRDNDQEIDRYQNIYKELLNFVNKTEQNSNNIFTAKKKENKKSDKENKKDQNIDEHIVDDFIQQDRQKNTGNSLIDDIEVDLANQNRKNNTSENILGLFPVHEQDSHRLSLIYEYFEKDARADEEILEKLRIFEEKWFGNDQ